MNIYNHVSLGISNCRCAVNRAGLLPTYSTFHPPISHLHNAYFDLSRFRVFHQLVVLVVLQNGYLWN